MKTRVEYNNNELGLSLAKKQVKKYGGRAVTVEGKNYWYSFHYTQSEIFADHYGKNVDIH